MILSTGDHLNPNDPTTVPASRLARHERECGGVLYWQDMRPRFNLHRLTCDRCKRVLERQRQRNSSQVLTSEGTEAEAWVAAREAAP